MIFKPKKKHLLSDSTKKRVEKEIELLSNSLPEGVVFKSKEFEIGYYINVLIDKKRLNLDINFEDKNIPEFINFLIVVDSQFPIQPPKVLSKTKFCYPSLMDGRDLFREVFQSKWTEKNTLIDIAKAIPNFIFRVLNSKVNNFYGEFHLGGIYDLKNFGSMFVNTFSCKFEKTDYKIVKQNENDEMTLILSDDCLILFENTDAHFGKICFWSTLYSLVDMQVNKMQKIASINFYNDETNEEKYLKLKIDNILFFREALVKRMSDLKIKVEHTKIIKGQQLEKKLNDKDINSMKIEELAKHIGVFNQRLESNDITYYNVKTLMSLCQKAIEYYSAINDPNYLQYLNIIKNMFSREEVSKLLNSDGEEKK